jgi:hypothetical protein
MLVPMIDASRMNVVQELWRARSENILNNIITLVKSKCVLVLLSQ